MAINSGKKPSRMLNKFLVENVNWYCKVSIIVNVEIHGKKKRILYLILNKCQVSSDAESFLIQVERLNKNNV